MTKPQKIFSYRDNQALNKDLQQLYDYISRLEVTNSNPDGLRIGRLGDVVLLQTGGNNYVEICTDDNTTTWRGVQLSDTP